MKRPSAPESRRPQFAVCSETSEQIRLGLHESIFGGVDNSGVEPHRSTLRRQAGPTPFGTLDNRPDDARQSNFRVERHPFAIRVQTIFSELFRAMRDIEQY